MASQQHTLRATLGVCLALVLAFVLTGFASSAYHREKTELGARHYSHGRALAALGNLEGALEEYRKAQLFSPENTDYRISLATALVEDHRLVEAQSYLEQLVQEDPTSGQLNLLLGRVAAQRKQMKQAIDYYQRGVYEYWPASELDQRRQARWELADLLRRSGDSAGFVAELMQLYTNLPPGETAQRLKVGSLLYANGASSEALRIFQDLAKQQPQDGTVHRDLGEAYFRSGDFLSARHEFQRAIHLNSKDRDSTQDLSLTNDVIDMDANFPYITSAEQLRRSRNLLARVMKNLDACNAGASPVSPGAAAPASPQVQATTSGKSATVSPTTAPHSQSGKAQTLRTAGAPQAKTETAINPQAQRLEDARALLAGDLKTDDVALSMQTTAAKLWDDRAALCHGQVPQDKALIALFAGIRHE